MSLARQRISYSIGNEHNPADPFGRCRLVIETDSRARLDKFTRSGRFAWTGTVKASALDSFWSALERAKFPSFPRTNVPAGGAMHALSIGPGPATAQSACIYIGASAALPGYCEAFTIIDAIIRQMSDESDASPPAALKVESVTCVDPNDPRIATQLSPGTAFLLAYLSSRRVIQSARRDLLDHHASSDDPALADAIDSMHQQIDDEQSKSPTDDIRLAAIAGAFDMAIPGAPVRHRAYAGAASMPWVTQPEDETPAWLTAIAEAVRPRLPNPVLAAAWRAGEAARFVAVCAALVATVAHLRCAAPENADLRVQALDLARDLTDSVATLKARLEAINLTALRSRADDAERLVHATSLRTSGLTSAAADAYGQLNDLSRAIGELLEDTARRLDAATPAPSVIPDLQRALEDGAYRESLLASSAPVAVFLQRAGAFFEPMYEEIDYTDWNGAIVGRGPGSEIRAAIPPDPMLPFADFEPLLSMGTFARVLVARHPSTPTEVLLALADDPNVDVQCAVLERSTNDPSVLNRLRASGFASIRTRLGVAEPERPAPTTEQLHAKANDSDASVRWGVARFPALPEELMEKLAGDPAIDVRHVVAMRPDITVAVLTRIMEHELAPKIVAALAENPATPPSVLARLSTVAFAGAPIDGVWPTTAAEVRVLIARRSSLPRDMVLAYARDGDYRVREALAQNPSTDPAILDQLMDDRVPCVRGALAKHPRFTNLLLLATDPSADVCAALAARTDATVEVLEVLARSPSSMVRVAIARRTDTPREVLELLTHDSQTLVRNQATETLEALRTAPSPSSVRS